MIISMQTNIVTNNKKVYDVKPIFNEFFEINWLYF